MFDHLFDLLFDSLPTKVQFGCLAFAVVAIAVSGVLFWSLGWLEN